MVMDKQRYSMCQEGTRMLVIPLPTACPVSPEGRGAQVRTAADSLKPQGQGQGSSLILLLVGSRRSVYSSSKGDESRDKSSIFETMIFTAEPHGADRSIDCFCCRCIHSPPMNRSKYSAQVPYSNEPTVAYVHPPMERPMER